MLNRVQLFVTPWTVAHQAPLSISFFRQEYWSGLPFPSPGDFPDPGIELASLASAALAGRFFTTNAPWEALHIAEPGSESRDSHALLVTPTVVFQSDPVKRQTSRVRAGKAGH